MKKFIGIAIMIIIAVAAVIVSVKSSSRSSSTPPPPSQVPKVKDAVLLRGLAGGETVPFLSNPKVQQILLDRYAVKLDFQKAGSLEMPKADVKNYDFFFTASQVAADELRGKMPGASVENIFSSPLVFYSWKPVRDAFIAQGIAYQAANKIDFVSDSKKLLKLIQDGKTWETVGVAMKTPMTLVSSHPAKTNSGSVYAALLATTFNDGNVVEEKDFAKVLPLLSPFFKGYMESSTTDLFDGYINANMGVHPIIVGYENQMIEFAVTKPKLWETAKDRVSVLYPEPTIWSNHRLITTRTAKVLIEALRDPDIQEIAWREHGFRTSLVGVHNKIAGLPVTGVPEEINNVMQMPSVKVQEQIIAAFAK